MDRRSLLASSSPCNWSSSDKKLCPNGQICQAIWELDRKGWQRWYLRTRTRTSVSICIPDVPLLSPWDSLHSPALWRIFLWVMKHEWACTPWFILNILCDHIRWRPTDYKDNIPGSIVMFQLYSLSDECSNIWCRDHPSRREISCWDIVPSDVIEQNKH